MDPHPIDLSVFEFSLTEWQNGIQLSAIIWKYVLLHSLNEYGLINFVVSYIVPLILSYFLILSEYTIHPLLTIFHCHFYEIWFMSHDRGDLF